MTSTITVLEAQVGVDDPTAPENLEKSTGRGLLLMKAFSNDVKYNEKGNKVTFQLDVVEKE
jgi:anti-sigma regulatory factor (Ser/Thr protein kinase)